MRRTIFVFVLTLGTLLVGCDAAGPENDADPEPHFEITLGGPVNASIQGKAALGNGTSFDEQAVFIHPLERLGKTVTAIQLFGEEGSDVAHDLSFLYFADGAITSGTYEVGVTISCEEPSDCTPRTFPPDEMLMAQYTHLTTDSLHAYTLKTGGTLTIDRATDEIVEGTFSFEARSEASISRSDLEAFQDTLRDYMRNHPPENRNWEDGYWEDMPEPPPLDLQPLDPPLTIEGQFTATPGSFSDRIPRSSWMVTAGAAMPDQP